MHYYVTYYKGEISGFVQSPVPRSIPNSVQVSEKEFVSLGGMISPERESELSSLKAQVQAQSERSDFLEDCIAEMAMEVYGGA